jgi:hypothetical protein
MELAMLEEADVILVALAEALKVRTISKGPALTYFVLKPVQKFLFAIIRRFPCFLSGRDISSDILDDMFCGVKTPSNYFFSLDYTSATDMLDPWLSSKIVDGICDAVEMPPNIRILFHKALTGHKIDGIEQKWGQLMGSIVSFIVLNVANAIMVIESFQISENKKFSFKNVPMLINGDDGLVCASDNFMEIWKNMVGSVGLLPSQGKTYKHIEMANMNSTCFIFRDGRFNHIPYLNFGLIVGNKRSGGKVTKFDIFSPEKEFDKELGRCTLGARHRELIASCPRRLVMFAHEYFLERNKEILESVHNIPWYIPESLGGVGLAPIVLTEWPEEGMPEIFTQTYLYTSKGQKCGPSNREVSIAKEILKLKLDESSLYNIPSRIPALQPVQARSLWSSVLRENYGVIAKDVMTEDESSFMDTACFYLCPSAVMQEIDATTQLSVLRRNERVWGLALRNFVEGDDCENGDLFL